MFGHHFDDPDRPTTPTRRRACPSAWSLTGHFDWEGDARPTPHGTRRSSTRPTSKGFTQRHPDVPQEIRGNYAGLAHPAITGYLTDLGITAVELLPVHQFVHDSHLLERGLANYWGYNSIGFFAPHGGVQLGRHAAARLTSSSRWSRHCTPPALKSSSTSCTTTRPKATTGPDAFDEGHRQPRLLPARRRRQGHYFDTTGTGNSLNVGHPAALRLITGLAAVLGHRNARRRLPLRPRHHPYPPKRGRNIHSAFLNLVHQDPVLAPVKLIAEPWDIAGYQLGGFPARWSEWNGKYRDDVRDFWRGAEGALGELALRLTGSGDIYSSDRRVPTASINFVTAHDGFTLADLTAYNEKHNEANGEDNNDGETTTAPGTAASRADRRRCRSSSCGSGNDVTYWAHSCCRRAYRCPGRRRDRPDPERQQQRLLPGQRDFVVRLGQPRQGTAGLRQRRHRATTGAPGLAAKRIPARRRRWPGPDGPPPPRWQTYDGR